MVRQARETRHRSDYVSQITEFPRLSLFPKRDTTATPSLSFVRVVTLDSLVIVFMVFQRVRTARICGFASVSPSGRHAEVREKKGLLVNTDHTVGRKQPRAQEPEQTVSLALPLFPSRRSSCIH